MLGSGVRIVAVPVYSYKLTFSVEGEPTILQDWVVSIDEVRHNATVEPNTLIVR